LVAASGEAPSLGCSAALSGVSLLGDSAFALLVGVVLVAMFESVRCGSDLYFAHDLDPKDPRHK
jgi:hypothetical protein